MKCLLITLWALTLSGCTAQMIRNYSDENTYFEDESEVLTHMANFQMQQLYSLDPHPEAWGVLVQITQRLETAQGKDKTLSHHPVVPMEMPMINALTFPNGQIVVTTPLLRAMPSEDALAFVLGHELGHAHFRHYRQKINRLALDVFFRMVTHVFDQENELEADQYGIELMARAGYDPHGALEFFEFLTQQEAQSESGGGGMFKSHPASETRLARLREAIQKLKTTPQKPHPSSRAFVAMKESYLKESLTYAPVIFFPDSPPRFHGSSKTFNEGLEEAQKRLNGRFDLEETESLLNGLPTQTNREKAVVAAWKGRLSLLKRDKESMEKSLAEAEKLWPGLESIPWLRILSLALEGKNEEAREAWKLRAFSAPCQENLDCLVGALHWNQLASAEDARTAAQNLRSFLKEHPHGREENTALNLAVATDISQGLTQDVDDRTRNFHLPESFTPTPQVRDLQEIHREYLVSGDRLGVYREMGLHFGFGMGPGGFMGDLAEPLGWGLLLDLQAGFRFWPFEVGFIGSMHAPRSRDFPSGQRFYYSTQNYGVYFSYLHGRGQWRPSFRLGILSHEVDRKAVSDASDESPTAVSRGMAVESMAFLTYRFLQAPIPLFGNTDLRLGAGGRYMGGSPFLGTTGRGFSWQVVMGLDFFLNLSPTGEAAEELQRRPKVFR